MASRDHDWLFRFWGCLPLEVVFISNLCSLQLGPIILSLNLGKNKPVIAEIICWGHFPLDVVLIFMFISGFCETSDQWLLIYYTFNILRSSSVGDHLYFKPMYSSVWFLYLKFEILERSNQWFMRYFILNTFMSTSIGGHLHFKPLCTSVWSSYLNWKFG